MPLVLERSWIGRRVSVRRALGHGPDGRARFGDVVGDLIGLDEREAVIETRRGTVAVPTSTVAVARLVPPSTADELALEAVAAAGWRPEETGAVGGWMLRAASGCTRRANSVLPLRAPRLSLDEALTQARAWYGQRGLPLQLQIPIEARRLLDAELGERGWPASPVVHVLAARLDTLSAAPLLAGRAVRLSEAPDDAWLARYRGGAGRTPAARGLLSRHDRVVFAQLGARVDTGNNGGGAIAIARGVVDSGWLGVSAVEVAPLHRRQGLCSAVVAALWEWGTHVGATRSYLQVSSENAAALALHERLGYLHHHDYRYRIDPVR